MDLQHYDIIVLGAGISGMLIGSELSKEHSVLIIEKENSIPDNKYWLTNKKCLKNNLELAECINTEYSHMDFISYDGLNYRCFGEYLLWDTDLLLRKLEKILIQNSGILLRKHTFYSYKYLKSLIVVNVNNKQFSAKLLIDCMGYSSPIIYAKNLIKIYGYYILHGRSLRLKKNLDPIGLSNIVLSSHPKYLEIFPRQDSQAYVVLIEPEKSIRSSGSLLKEFKFIIEKSEYSDYFISEESDTRHLWGLIPIGRLNSNSLNNIFLYGEAGQMNPGATATCFTQLLYSYKEMSFRLSEKIRNNKLDRYNLQIENPFFSNRNKKFHLHLFNSILKWNSDDFKKLIYLMGTMEYSLVNEIIFGEINFSSLMKLKSIKQLIKKRNYFVLNPLFKSLF